MSSNLSPKYRRHKQDQMPCLLWGSKRYWYLNGRATRSGSAEDLKSRKNINCYDLIGATCDRVYGVATYVRSYSENASLSWASINNNIHEVMIKTKEITIINVYKTLAALWSHMYSEHTPSNPYGVETLIAFITNFGNTRVTVCFEPKDRSSFLYAAWIQGHCANFGFVSCTSHS